MASNAVSLNGSTLDRLSKRIAVPTYDRRALIPAIVHIGAGGFNRSHLCVYLDDLLSRPDTARLAECGVGLLPGDMRIHAGLQAQDHLYSLLVRDADEKSLRVIGSIVEHLYAPEAPEKVIERMSARECAIVSMTVTEGGYFIDDGSGAFAERHPDITYDLSHPNTPRTFLGFIVEAAHRRMKRGLPPFTLLSCDNVQCNGDVARRSVLAFAEMRNPELRLWIERNVAFPSSMVDRITPGTTDADREFISTYFGVSDMTPVVSEPFRQWVIEDTFCNLRPKWEAVGAQFTTDVKPFEMIKMRLLNGGHSTIAYVAAVVGHTYVSQALEDELIRHLLEMFLEEVTCTLPALPGMELGEYKRSIVHRFSNPTIRDQILRICSEASAKIAKFIVPSAKDLLAAGKVPAVIPFMIASWLFSMRGIDEQGRVTNISDGSAKLWNEFVSSGCRNVDAAFAVKSVFGDLGASTEFKASVRSWLERLHSSGVHESIQRLLETTGSCDMHVAAQE